jgi:ketosteroid isomerase-like protein
MDLAGQGLKIGVYALEQQILEREFNIEEQQRDSELALLIDDARFEVQQMVKELETMESDVRAKLQELYGLREAIHQSFGSFQAVLAEGERLLTERDVFRKRAAADVQDYRYQDMGFRTFRNDEVQKYRATFELAARYGYLAATAYDYETNLLGSESGSGRAFLTDIVKQRSPGVIMDGKPVVGKRGLADPLARLSQNFEVYEGQLGFNNPQTETNRFALRRELFRFKDEPASDPIWRAELDYYRVPDLWDFPPFKRFCRPFADESTGPQPGLVIPFSTEVNFGYNFFGWPLGGGDSSYDPSNFATKIRSVGVWFEGYDNAGLSSTPRVYLVPVGADVLRTPDGDDFTTREWHVVDQKLPVPFPVSDAELSEETWIPVHESLSDVLGGIRRFSSFRAFPDSDLSSLSEAEIIQSQTTTDTRLIGRSVWNTQWLLIIPGGTLLADPDAGLDAFIDNVTDIKLFFQTYAYSGN